MTAIWRFCRSPRIAAAAGLLAVLVISASATAEPKPPWRGSAFVYQNAVSVSTLDRSKELTYNPYYAMTFSFQPRLWFDDTWYVRARLDLVRELTEQDNATFDGETWAQDLILVAGANKLATIPLVGVEVSTDLMVTLPTSKSSQARSLALGLGPALKLSRKFDLLEGLTVRYHARAHYFFHRYTTKQRETPLIQGCSSSIEGCDPFLNLGERNTNWRLIHGPDLSLQATTWLSASAAFYFVTDWLYFLEDRDPKVSYEPMDAQDQRHASLFEVNLTGSPTESLDITIGYSTTSPSLAPDSTFYNPLYNPYSMIYVDLRLDIEGLIDQIAELASTEG